MEEETCCFLGPSPSAGADHGYFNGWETVLRQELCRLIGLGEITNFISALTPGLELLGAELVLELSEIAPRPLSLECIIPSERQTQALSPQTRERVLSILNRCHRKTLLWTSPTYMVDCSHTVLALPNAEGLDYARKQGRIIHLLHGSVE